MENALGHRSTYFFLNSISFFLCLFYSFSQTVQTRIHGHYSRKRDCTMAWRSLWTTPWWTGLVSRMPKRSTWFSVSLTLMGAVGFKLHRCDHKCWFFKVFIQKKKLIVFFFRRWVSWKWSTWRTARRTVNTDANCTPRLLIAPRSSRRATSPMSPISRSSFRSTLLWLQVCGQYYSIAIVGKITLHGR